MVNRFYSLASAGTTPHPFDLPDLGTTRTELTPFGFLRDDGSLEGFEPFEVAVRAVDYDDAFLKKLLASQPVYAAGELLTYHFDCFLRVHPTGSEFLDHVAYVLLPKLKITPGSVHATLVESWLTTQQAMTFSHFRQQRLTFLAEAYKAACEYAPDQPLSVTISPFELGQRLGLDRASVSRIINELVQDKLLNSTLGMHFIYVTRAGVRELEGHDERPAPVQQNFHFAHGSTSSIATGDRAVQVTNTGAGSQVNVASGSVVQQTVTGQLPVSLPDLVAQLRAAFATEPKLASFQEEAGEEFQRLEAQLQRPEPKKNLLALSFEVLRELAQDGLGSVTGHAVFELLQHVPALLGAF
jgi:DNA-binding MarR family transcriptional regulator